MIINWKFIIAFFKQIGYIGLKSYYIWGAILAEIYPLNLLWLVPAKGDIKIAIIKSLMILNLTSLR